MRQLLQECIPDVFHTQDLKYARLLSDFMRVEYYSIVPEEIEFETLYARNHMLDVVLDPKYAESKHKQRILGI